MGALLTICLSGIRCFTALVAITAIMGLCLAKRGQGIGTHLAGRHFAGAASTCGPSELGWLPCTASA